MIVFTENMKNLGAHTIELHAVLNESGATTYAGRELPSHKIKFTIVGEFVFNVVL